MISWQRPRTRRNSHPQPYPPLYAYPEARESPETGEEQQGRGQPQSATVESQEPIQRPWWRRVFGG
jgi:hypothetical protein